MSRVWYMPSFMAQYDVSSTIFDINYSILVVIALPKSYSGETIKKVVPLAVQNDLK